MALTLADRVLVVTIAVIGLGAVAAVVASRSESDYPPGSPEAVVQDFMRDAINRDPVALDRLDPDLGCAARDLATAWISPQVRVDLVDATVDADQARLRVEVREGDEGGLGVGGYRREEVYVLQRQDGEWLITDFAWPLWCDGSGR